MNACYFMLTKQFKVIETRSNIMLYLSKNYKSLGFQKSSGLKKYHSHKKKHWSLKEASGSQLKVFVKEYLELAKGNKAK